MHRTRLEKIGEDIVNSISLHKFNAVGDEEDEVVAVLTNNDKTVRIYSLTQNLEITVLDLPFPMNHATISPCGDLLVAVGDQGQAFFFEQIHTKKSSSAKSPEGPARPVSSEWGLSNEVDLYLPPGNPCEGYFTTAWAPSGRLCAVGSECGYITVFDVDLLRFSEDQNDGVVQVIKSTRPDHNAGPGAVRTMMFSPSPWDLLIWSEDQGRVCVADLRASLRLKQVLSLDPNEEGLEKIDVADFDVDLSPELRELRRETDFIRRYRRALDSEGSAAAINFATDYIEASTERRRSHRQRGVVESDNDPHGLSAHERQILETLRSTRPREETREQRSTPRSINYLPPGSSSTEARRYGIAALESLSNLRSNRTRDRTLSRRDDGETEAEASLADLMRDGVRQLDLLHAVINPRRQSSIVIPNGSSSATNGATDETSNTNITDMPTTRSPNPIPPHARRAANNSTIVSATDEAWRTIEEAMARNARAAETARSSTTTDMRTELRRLRQLTQARERLRTARESLPQLPTLSQMISTFDGPYRRRGVNSSDGVRTAGLAMSQDGSRLYCGTEEGIFEFTINLHGRKACPAITPR